MQVTGALEEMVQLETLAHDHPRVEHYTDAVVPGPWNIKAAVERDAVEERRVGAHDKVAPARHHNVGAVARRHGLPQSPRIRGAGHEFVVNSTLGPDVDPMGTHPGQTVRAVERRRHRRDVCDGYVVSAQVMLSDACGDDAAE